MNLKYNALLIDDSKPISFYNNLILERSDLFDRIEIAKNGLDALALLNDNFKPDIIFLDLNMPVMNGWEFLEKYSSSEKDLCPIILLLGTEQSSVDKSKLLDYPAVMDIKPKMLSENVLLAIINNILEHST